MTQMPSSGFVPWFYHLCKHSTPTHRGKGYLMRRMERSLARSKEFFAWRMRDGQYIAVRPDEALRSYGVGATCYHEGIWEPHVAECIKRHLRPGDLAVDIGANIGVCTVAMARAVGPGGRVESFEPAGRTYEQLKKSIALNQLNNVSAHQLAVSNETGKLTLKIPRDVSGNASAFERPGSTDVDIETVQVVKLDDFLAQSSSKPVRLMKVDAEGSELVALQGAKKIIQRDKPVLIIEVNPETSAAAGWSNADLNELLEEVGPYRTSLIVGEGRLVHVPLSEMEVESSGYADLCCMPA